MKPASKHLSSFLAIKGPCCEPTYRVFSSWDLTLSQQANLLQIQESNSIGARSNGWLQQLIRVIKQRYNTDGPDRTLVELAQHAWSIDEWRPAQLWHISRSDQLLNQFFVDCLFNFREQGLSIINSDIVVEYLRGIVKKSLGTADAWTATTYRRSANALLKSSVDFQLMKGRVKREFDNYRLPDRSFIYLLYQLMSKHKNTKKMIEAEDWRLFLMKPVDVEEELLRLHQYGKLHFERAGSFLELTLPHPTIDEFILNKDSTR